jgi:hypothetical protein
MTHTSAEPDDVPCDVTTGELELRPKASEDAPTKLKVGLPDPSKPYL